MTQKLKELIYLLAIVISTLCALSSVLFSLNPAITATVTFIAVLTFAVVYFIVPTTDNRSRRVK
ncbi:hypothetical protein C7J88_06885 [Staphylococcus muscae]|uniref:Uncharacterized protein n=1 Tax=Staphylococcus muscae TaxID=1294 RepID=A0A240C9J2_9STAP|nr:hypothetical protein [Staphylococcus muscae]AVQ33913.1 hypothetical protein C7J88_06885 [Staphylococcus muscae]PNZ04557.1 hypothetical protein CD131_04230 [Staphylococcus muscae]GGA83324.1 hypothetical protein GCM10007183_04400 [Staphylococcus muscae]SNW04634.1 Uncharacterised protein [Staphylococcus muscae]